MAPKEFFLLIGKEMNKHKNFTETLADGISFDMIWVEGGSFLMGNREEDAESV